MKGSKSGRKVKSTESKPDKPGINKSTKTKLTKSKPITPNRTITTKPVANRSTTNSTQQLFSTHLINSLTPSNVHHPFDITQQTGLVPSLGQTSGRGLQHPPQRTSPPLTTSRRTIWGGVNDDDDEIPLGAPTRGGKNRNNKKNSQNDSNSFNNLFGQQQGTTSQTRVQTDSRADLDFDQSQTRSTPMSKPMRSFDDDGDSVFGFDPSSSLKKSLQFKKPSFNDSINDWHEVSKNSSQSKPKTGPTSTHSRDDDDDQNFDNFDSFDGPSTKTTKRPSQRQSHFDYSDDSHDGGNSNARGGGDENDSSWQWPNKQTSTRPAHNTNQPQPTQSDETTQSSELQSPPGATSDKIFQPPDADMNYREFAPYSNKKSPNSYNQQQYGSKFGSKGQQFDRNEHKHGRFNNGDHHHNTSFYGKGSLNSPKDVQTTASRDADFTRKSIDSWQRFDTADADHDIGQVVPGNQSFDAIRDGHRKAWDDNGRPRGGGGSKFGHSGPNQLTPDESINIDPGMWSSMASSLPSDEMLQSALKKYLPPTPFITGPMSHEALKNHNRKKYNNNINPLATTENTMLNDGDNSTDMYNTFSRLIESIRSTNIPNSGTNYDTVQAHIGGRLNNAINHVYSQYRSRGLLLFVDVFHPWLNVVHWTRILNSLISSNNYHVATLLFETYLLPRDNTAEEQEILDHINNPLGEQAANGSGDVENNQATKPNQSLNTKSHRKGLITSVDKKLITEIITAYSRCKPPQELLKLLSNLEKMDLLPDSTATKHLLSTICSAPSDYDSEYFLFNTRTNGGGQGDIQTQQQHQAQQRHGNQIQNNYNSQRHNTNRQHNNSSHPSHPGQKGEHFPSPGQFRPLIPPRSIHPFYKSTLIHPYVTFSMLMSFYHDFRQQALLKLITQPQQFNIKTGTNSTVVVPYTPIKPPAPFIHARGQLMNYSQMYAQLGFVSALHGLLKESLANQGLIETQHVESLISLATSMNRLDHLFGVTQNRYKYFNRHLGESQSNQNMAISDYFQSNSVTALALPWSNLHTPTTALVTGINSNPKFGQLNNHSTVKTDKNNGKMGNYKDHFAHTIDYDNLDLQSLGVDSPAVLTTEIVADSQSNTDTSLVAKSTTKTLAFPKFPSHKRFVLVQTGLGMGLEVYTNDQYYYQQHGKTPPPPKAQKNGFVPFDPPTTGGNDPNQVFNPAATIAAITPNSTHYAMSHPIHGVSPALTMFRGVNTHLITKYARKAPKKIDLGSSKYDLHNWHTQGNQIKQQHLQAKEEASLNDKPKGVVNTHYFNILRHLQPDPFLIISLRPNQSGMKNKSLLGDLNMTTNRTGPIVNQNNLSGIRRRHVVDTEVKRRQDVFLPDVASSSVNSKQSSANNQAQQSVHIAVIPVVPNSNKKSPTKPESQEISPNESQQSVKNTKKNPIKQLCSLLAQFSSTNTSSPLLSSPQSTNQLFHSLAQTRSYGLLSKATTFYTHHHHVYHPTTQNPAPAPSHTVKILLENPIFSNLQLAPNGQILSPHLRLLSRLSPHHQPPPIPLSDSENDDSGTTGKSSQSQMAQLANLAPYSSISFTVDSIDKSVRNSPFDGVLVASSVADLARKRAKKVTKPKFHLPLFLTPYLVHYEDATNHPDDQAQIQSVLHLMSSFGNGAEEFLHGQHAKKWVAGNDPSNSYYIQTPTLINQLKLQYPHIYNAVGNNRTSAHTDVESQKDSVRVGVVVVRRLLLGAVSRIVNSQNKAQARVLAHYDQIIQSAINSEDDRVGKRVVDNDRNSWKNKKYGNNNKRPDPKNAATDANADSETSDEVRKQIQELFPMSTKYISADTYKLDVNDTTDGTLTAPGKNTQHKHVFLASNTLQELKSHLSQWSTESQSQINSLVSLLESYTYTPHPELVDEYFSSVLPLLIDLGPQLGLNPANIQKLCEIGVDLALASHFHSTLTPTPLVQHKTKRAMAMASLEFAREETDLVTNLSDGEINSLVTDSYLGTLGLPQVSTFIPFSGSQIGGLGKFESVETEDDAQTRPNFSHISHLRSENCSFSPPNLRTAPSALHTRLLKLLATLSEVSKGSPSELSGQLGLASRIANQFAEKGDLNSTLIWCTLVAHMKQNINKTLEKELIAEFGGSDTTSVTTTVATSGQSGSNPDLRSPFQLISQKIQPAHTTAELLRPVDQLKIGQRLNHQTETSQENKVDDEGHNGEDDPESRFQTVLQQHFDLQMEKDKANGSQTDETQTLAQDKDLQHNNKAKRNLVQSKSPTLPLSFYPSGPMSPGFVMQLNQNYMGKNGRLDQSEPNQPLSKPIPSPFQRPWPQSIKPVTSLGQILQLLPDISLTTSSIGSGKANFKFLDPSNKLQKTLQQSLRSFEHALMMSESNTPLPKLMPSLVYLETVQAIFKSVIYSNTTNLDTYTIDNDGDDDISSTQNKLPSQKPSFAAFSNVVNSSLATFHLFWHLLACVEQKQVQHGIGIDTSALVGSLVPQSNDVQSTDLKSQSQTEQSRRSFIYPSSSPALITSLGQFLNQPTHFNLDTTLAQVLTIASKLAALPQPHKTTRHISGAIVGDGADDTSDSPEQAENLRQIELEQDEILGTHHSLLHYTDALVCNIIAIWDPAAKSIDTEEAEEAGADTDSNDADSALYTDILSLKSPFSAQPDAVVETGRGGVSSGGKPTHHGPKSDIKLTPRPNQNPDPIEASTHLQDQYYDPSVQNGPLGYAKPTPALVAAINAYVNNRLKQNNSLSQNNSLTDIMVQISDESNSPITLQTYFRVQRAVKRYLTAHSPNALQQLEAFKMHRDHQKVEALELLHTEVQKDEVQAMLRTKQRDSIESQTGNANRRQKNKKHNVGSDDTVLSTDFAIVTPGTDLELQIDIVLEEIQSGDVKHDDENDEQQNDSNDDEKPSIRSKHNNGFETEDLDSLLQGQYPYPLTLTLSKISTIAFGESIPTVTKAKSSKSASHIDLQNPEQYPQFDSEGNNQQQQLDNPAWFPSRSQLRQRLGLGDEDEQSENENGPDDDAKIENGDQDNEDNEPINIIHLDGQASSIRIDSHLNSHDAMGTLFQVVDSLHAKVNHLEKKISRLESILDHFVANQDQPEKIHPNLAHLNPTDLEKIEDQLNSHDEHRQALSQRHTQAKILLQLFTKNQNNSYLDLLTQHVEQLEIFTKKPDLDTAEPTTTTTTTTTKGDKSSPQVQSNPHGFRRDGKQNLELETNDPKKQKDYFPVPFYSQSTDSAPVSSSQSATNNPPAAFSFQKYHNTMVQGCFDSIASTLASRRELKAQQQQSQQQQQQQPPPNPALFLLQPNRTLTAKEAMAFELFLKSLE